MDLLNWIIRGSVSLPEGAVLKQSSGSVTLQQDAAALSIPAPAGARLVTVTPDAATAEAIRSRTGSCISALLFTDLIALNGVSMAPAMLFKQIRTGSGSVASGAIASADLSQTPLTASGSSSMPFPAGTYLWTACVW